MKILPENYSPYDMNRRLTILGYARAKAEENAILKRQYIKDATQAFMRNEIGLTKLRGIQETYKP